MAQTDASCDDIMLDRLFRHARTHNDWDARPVNGETVRALYNLAKWGPTTANSNPARFVFIRSAQAKARLMPHINAGNVDKVTQAPCTVIIAGDTRFYEEYGTLFPSRDMRSVFEGKDALIAETVARSSTLQGAYLIMAARAMVMDCGPMSGFDAAGVDGEFFADGRWKVNFLCNIGHGRPEAPHPRNPRLDFDTACLDL